jgi:hypothetical protein
MQVADDKVATAPIGRMMLNGIDEYGSHSLMIVRHPSLRLRAAYLFLVSRSMGKT